ncbi:MAG: hybrid sensor histidine kinase/response regulator [Desulfurivibrio sp.]|nr:MAG: hybrid sensor histidine kinase/response regulator [Desulfurivibrio sp.]
MGGEPAVKSEMATPLRVLIVEDSENDAILMIRELHRGGYEPRALRVETAEAMQEALAAGEWDIIISDYVLPRFSGLAALHILKQSGRDLPFIVISGNIGEDIAVGAMKAGAHDYILKGNLTRLVPAVDRELREAVVRRERRQAQEALQRSYGELEQRVRERTEELRASKRELERLVGELERSNQELEQFAYVASHDLQEPLRVVSSFMDLLERRFQHQLDDKARLYIQYAQAGSERMSQLISDLLKFSRVRRGSWEPEPVDLHELFRQIVADCRTVIQETGAVITCEPLPVVQGEPAQLCQLLQNLLLNAVKFRRPDVIPEVHISASRQDRHWLLAVRDNGIGIAPEQHQRIFVIFQRLHSREKYDGTGIGLAICQRVVDFHGGRIWVESEPGRGSTFLFNLPA